ncbi:hypothetical protein ABZ840_35970 [Streptomyces sp. NPDC047117]|uniref:hypothetical protein n=1 Tax=Streptomyces sp. NPDC047117 TaxID=3155379 RepID=UPI0033D53D9C
MVQPSTTSPAICSSRRVSPYSSPAGDSRTTATTSYGGHGPQDRTVTRTYADRCSTVDGWRKAMCPVRAAMADAGSSPPEPARNDG